MESGQQGPLTLVVCTYFISIGLEMEIFWTLMHPLHDIDDVVALGQKLLGLEGSCLKTDPSVFRQYLTVASTNQIFDKGKEFLAIARNEDEELLGYCIYDRSGYTTYSRDEISNAKFHHVRLELPIRQRIRIINEMLDQHILWCHKWGIPIICSTSIRKDHSGFMKIHERRGFEISGSYAWGRTEDLIKYIDQSVPKG